MTIDTVFWNDLNNLLNNTLVPCYTIEVRPCTEEDYQDYAKNLEKNLEQLILKLDELLQNEFHLETKTKKFLIKVLIVIGEQHRKSPWNTCTSVELSSELISRICKIFKCSSVKEIFKDDDTFTSVLMLLRPKLLKPTWKSNPASVVCYKWLLESMEKPLLKIHVPDILPTALIIFDDYVPDNQIFGLECIGLIVEHCVKSKSLKNCNYDQVIYQALEKLMHGSSSTPDLIIPVYTCALNLLNVMEFCDDNWNDKKFGWTKRDDVVDILLENMELQNKSECRYAYAFILNKFLTFSSTAKQIKKFARILSEYCENVSDLRTTELALDSVSTLFSNYKPLNVNFYAAMYISLLKLQLDLSSEKKNETILKKAQFCIKLFNNICPVLSKEILNNKIVESTLNNL